MTRLTELLGRLRTHRIHSGLNGPMALSIPQMARMSRLLDEALALDEAGRRPWLERATLEHPDLAAALREALLPGAARAAELKVLMSLPQLDAADESSTPAASGLKPGARVGPYQLIRRLGAGGMAEVWLEPGAPMAPSSAR